MNPQRTIFFQASWGNSRLNIGKRKTLEPIIVKISVLNPPKKKAKIVVTMWSLVNLSTSAFPLSSVE